MPKARKTGEEQADPGTNPGNQDGTKSIRQNREPVAAPRLPLPRQFGGFELLEELGRGGMGIVYRARQKSPERIVALKMMLRPQAASGIDLQRFRAEAAAAARLAHPYIVSIHEVGEVDSQPFFTMDLVEGETLAQRTTDELLPSQVVAQLLLEVCGAVDYAHRHGILHRDLKPSNIMIDHDGHPHITDFGLAKQTSAEGGLTESGAVLGTPGYLAPEQASGTYGRVGVTSDVYSLGAVLYYLLTGQPPHQAATPLDTVLQVLQEDPPLPRDLNPAVDRRLEMIAIKCLQKPPELRYPSVAALADDLRAFVANEPIAARSGKLRDVVSRLLSETHHAALLRNWGLLWMLHSIVLFFLCVISNILLWVDRSNPIPYVALWGGGMGAWAVVFWALRRRSGPVTFVERQIAHLWGSSIIACVLLYAIECLLDLPALTLSPVLGAIAGMAFLAKAAILSGRFYIHSAFLFASSIPIALFPEFGPAIFGLVCGASFLLPGWKYHRLRAHSTSTNSASVGLRRDVPGQVD